MRWVLAFLLAVGIAGAAVGASPSRAESPITKRNNDAGLGPWRFDMPARGYRRAVRHSRPGHRNPRAKAPVQTDGAE
jgi:hypothetical protein